MTDPASNPLVGTWCLLSWQALAADGSIHLPLGADAQGLLIYSPEGTMLVLLATAGRPDHSSADPTGGNEAESARSMRTFLAYGGRYDIAGGQVTHHVEMSLLPNWVGSRQVREFQLDAAGERLTLMSPAMQLAGAYRVQRLEWVRRTG